MNPRPNDRDRIRQQQTAATTLPPSSRHYPLSLGRISQGNWRHDKPLGQSHRNCAAIATLEDAAGTPQPKWMVKSMDGTIAPKLKAYHARKAKNGQR